MGLQPRRSMPQGGRCTRTSISDLWRLLDNPDKISWLWKINQGHTMIYWAAKTYILYLVRRNGMLLSDRRDLWCCLVSAVSERLDLITAEYPDYIVETNFSQEERKEILSVCFVLLSVGASTSMIVNCIHLGMVLCEYYLTMKKTWIVRY